MITQERLKELVVYDPETGVFTSTPTRLPRRGTRASALGNVNRKGYAQHAVDGVRYSLQRMAFIYMTGDYPKPPYEIDHINGIKTDNRWCNLQVVTHRDNMNNPNVIEKYVERATTIPRCSLGRFYGQRNA